MKIKNITQKIALTLTLIVLGIAYSFAQQKQGIQFVQATNWQQVLDSAKAQYKYIFVDCYATWCGPCKRMDAEVYTDVALGKFIDPQFISVKVQMDSSKQDDEHIRAWYQDAHRLMAENNVNAYPTFLFFSPGGKLVHKAVGYNDPAGFLRAAFQATDPTRQEYTLLEQYKSGNLPYPAVPDLIRKLQAAGDKAVADEIAVRYIHDYLLKLPEELLYQKENIYPMSAYVKSSADGLFAFFYKNADKIDRATTKEFAEYFIARVITREEVNPKLWSDAKRQNPIATGEPDWASLHRIIEKKYNQYYADEALFDPQIAWSKQHEQWNTYIGLEVKKIERYSIDSAGHVMNQAELGINNVNYTYIFMYSQDKAILAKAMDWQKQIVDKYPDRSGYRDTYACLLYKLGHKKEAIAQEEQAIRQNKEQYLKLKEGFEKDPAHFRDPGKTFEDFVKDEGDDGMPETLTKMKTGQIIWNK